MVITCSRIKISSQRLKTSICKLCTYRLRAEKTNKANTMQYSMVSLRLDIYKIVLYIGELQRWWLHSECDKDLGVFTDEASILTRLLSPAKYSQKKHSGGKKRGKIPTGILGPFKRTMDLLDNRGKGLVELKTAEGAGVADDLENYPEGSQTRPTGWPAGGDHKRMGWNSSIWADWLRPCPPAPEKHGCHRRQIPRESHSSIHTISVTSNASSAWLAPNHAGLSHTLLSTPPTKYCVDCFAWKVLALHFFLLVTALDASVSDSNRTEPWHSQRSLRVLCGYH